MRIFIAGTTGATGQVLVPVLTEAGFDLVLHVRPQSADKLRDARARVFELVDADALAEAMCGCDAVISLVGTYRAREWAGVDPLPAKYTGQSGQRRRVAPWEKGGSAVRSVVGKRCARVAGTCGRGRRRPPDADSGIMRVVPPCPSGAA